jgi:hypothetical protein
MSVLGEVIYPHHKEKTLFDEVESRIAVRTLSKSDPLPKRKFDEAYDYIVPDFPVHRFAQLLRP